MRFISLFVLAAILFSTLPLFAQEAVVAEVVMTSPATLDPIQLSRFDMAGRDLVENLFVGLTRFNVRTGQIEPDLAESWTISEDGLIWTFKLRDDVQWVRLNQESQEYEVVRPVVAADVVFAIHRACQPDRPASLNTNMYIVAGCKSYANAQTLEAIDPARTIGARALDDTTLEFRLLFPGAFFLTMTSLPEFRPMPSEFVDNLGGGWFRPGNLVSSGRWVVTEWLQGTSMKLARNPFWEGEFEGNLEQLNIRFDVPVETLLGEISGGTVDAARLPDQAVSAVMQSNNDLLHATEGATLTLLGFSYNNVSAEGVPVQSPLDADGVRRALALALDRDALASTVYGNLAVGRDHFTPRSVIAAPSAPGASFDPVAAQQALANAGYPGCAGLGQLTFAVTADPLDQQLAQQMILQWNTHLGCPVENFSLVQVTRREILDSAHATVDVTKVSRFPLWLLTWVADYPDAQGWITDALHCNYGYFRVGRLCESVDTMMDQAGVIQDPRTRFNAYNQIELTLFGSNGTFPVVPLVMEQRWWVQALHMEGIGSYGSFQFDRWTVQ